MEEPPICLHDFHLPKAGTLAMWTTLLFFLAFSYSPTAAQVPATDAPPRPKAMAANTLPWVLLISGFDSDPSPVQLQGKALLGQGNSGMYQLAQQLNQAGYSTRFFNWNGTDAGQGRQSNPPGAEGIGQWFQQQRQQHPQRCWVVIGHSWGAHSLFQALASCPKEDSQAIALCFCVDGSSLSRFNKDPLTVPDVIPQVVNYHTSNVFVWGMLNDDRVTNINLGDPGLPYAANGRRNYGAKLDIHAHNHVEWDPLIHQDIQDRIQQWVQSQAPSADSDSDPADSQSMRFESLPGNSSLRDQ